MLNKHECFNDKVPDAYVITGFTKVEQVVVECYRDEDKKSHRDRGKVIISISI